MVIPKEKPAYLFQTLSSHTCPDCPVETGHINSLGRFYLFVSFSLLQNTCPRNGVLSLAVLPPALLGLSLLGTVE
jgi:hypothetical protein